MKTGADALIDALKNLADPAIAAHSRRFFKTGPGEYAQGDQFFGIRVPLLRKQAALHRSLALADIQQLLDSPYHEVRLCALFILIHRFNRADEAQQTAIHRFYLSNTRNINNWDLVDASAYKLLGAYLIDKDRHVLYRLCDSDDLWERRIAIMSTLAFIKQGQFDDSLKLAGRLLHDEHDLIHKAVGWMLREVGNRDRACEISFLDKHAAVMPRTMLRYAIEKFPPSKRKHYLSRRP